MKDKQNKRHHIQVSDSAAEDRGARTPQQAEDVIPLGDIIQEQAGAVHTRDKPKVKERFFSVRNITLLAVLSAIAVVLYNFVAIRTVPFFPNFLSLDISDTVVLISGFMLGPIGGAVVVVVRFLLKLPMSNTMMVGETADLIMGLVLVLISSLIYKKNRTMLGAIVAIAVASAATIIAAVLLNRFVLVPFYVEVFFGGNWEPLLNMLGTLYNRDISRDNFFVFYLLLATIPFNILRLAICSVITLLLYKRLRWLVNKVSGRRG